MWNFFFIEEQYTDKDFIIHMSDYQLIHCYSRRLAVETGRFAARIAAEECVHKMRLALKRAMRGIFSEQCRLSRRMEREWTRIEKLSALGINANVVTYLGFVHSCILPWMEWSLIS